MLRLRYLLLCLFLSVSLTAYVAEAPVTDRAEAVRQASELLAKGKFSEAARIWTRLLRANPKDVQAIVMLGVLSAQLKQYADAEPYYKRALRLDANDPAILLNLALAHFKDADLMGAIPMLENVLKLQPGNEQAQTLLGIC